MRIGQMTDVKQKLQICGTAILVPKAQDLDAHWRALFVETESLDQLAAQRMDRMIGCINDLIRELANMLQRGALVPNRLCQALAFVGRMWPARLAETVLEHLAGSLQKQDVDLQSSFTQYPQLFCKVGEEGAFANVDNEGRTPDALLVITGLNQSGKRRQHCDRKIVDAKITEVLERIRRRRHARAAQPGDNHYVGRRINACGFLLFFFCAIERPASQYSLLRLVHTWVFRA